MTALSALAGLRCTARLEACADTESAATMRVSTTVTTRARDSAALYFPAWLPSCQSLGDGLFLQQLL